MANLRQRRIGQANGKPKSGDTCGHCSRECHSREKCPTTDVQCHNCSRKGHYSIMCRQPGGIVSTVQEDDTDTAFLGTMSDNKNVDC